MCAFDSWLHENTSYTYHGNAPITGLTHTEIDKLQLGFMVRHEQQADAREMAGATSLSDRRKRQHKQNIRQRLRDT